MIKTLSKLEIQENFLNLIKTIQKKLIDNIIPNSKILFKIRNKARMSRLTTSFQHHTGSRTNTIRQEKEIKDTDLEVRNKTIFVHR